MKVDAKIIEVDGENKKISLSIKEVMPIDPPSSKSESKAKDGSKQKKPLPILKRKLNRQSIGRHERNS